MAITVPGMVLSQPPIPRMASIWWPRTTSSMASAITSRLTREHFIPSWPIASPSVTTKVLNFSGTPPGVPDARLGDGGKVVEVARCRESPRCPRLPRATMGLSKSSSVKPTARSMARLGMRAMPSGHDPAARVQRVRGFAISCTCPPYRCREAVHVGDAGAVGADRSPRSPGAPRWCPTPRHEALPVRSGMVKEKRTVPRVTVERLQVDGDRRDRVRASTSSMSATRVLVGDPDRGKPEGRAVAGEDLGERLSDERLDAHAHQGLRRVLARGAAAEVAVRPGGSVPPLNRGSFERVRSAASPPFSSKRSSIEGVSSQRLEGDLPQVAGGDDPVGVDVVTGQRDAPALDRQRACLSRCRGHS